VVGGFDAGGRYATGVAVPAIGYLGPIRKADGPFLGKATAPFHRRVLSVSGNTGFLAGEVRDSRVRAKKKNHISYWSEVQEIYRSVAPSAARDSCDAAAGYCVTDTWPD
jgi:hypothetical protein